MVNVYPIAGQVYENLEFEQRITLAAAYRLFALHKMDDTVYTHLSVRLPATAKLPECFLIAPYGLAFDEITASNLIKVALTGEIISDNGGHYNPTGLVTHGGIYQARPDIHSVMHLHSLAGVAVSALKCGLMPISQFALQFYNRVSYHDYNGIAFEESEGRKMAQDLGHNKVLILRNHGLVTAASTIEEAFVLMFYLERACQVQLQILSTHQGYIVVPDEIAEKTAQGHIAHTQPLGKREWQALVRSLDRIDQSYKN